MKKIFLIIALALGIAGCKTIQYVPIETGHTTEVKDSTAVHYIDSIRIKDSIRVIPIERYIDIVKPVDTLHLETSLAEATAFFDGDFLKGEIHNKKGFEQHFQEKEHHSSNVKEVLKEVHDTTKIQVPVPVEVEKKVTPKLYPWSLGLNLFLILTIGIGTYFKFFYRK